MKATCLSVFLFSNSIVVHDRQLITQLYADLVETIMQMNTFLHSWFFVFFFFHSFPALFTSVVQYYRFPPIHSYSKLQRPRGGGLVFLGRESQEMLPTALHFFFVLSRSLMFLSRLHRFVTDFLFFSSLPSDFFWQASVFRWGGFY